MVSGFLFIVMAYLMCWPLSWLGGHGINKLWRVQGVRKDVSGLENKQNVPDLECKECCGGLVLEMLKALNIQVQQIAALISSHAEQNKVMARIVDQNSELMAQLQGGEDEIEDQFRTLDGG